MRYKILIEDRNLFSVTLDVLDNPENDSAAGIRKWKKIGSNLSFFKLGVCSERTLISAVKSSSLSATIKLLEPVGLGGNKLKGKFGRLFKSSSDSLRVYKVIIETNQLIKRNSIFQPNQCPFIFFEQSFASVVVKDLKLLMWIH